MIPLKIRIIKSLLEEVIENINAGNSNRTEEELDEIIKCITKVNRGIKRISKREACEKILKNTAQVLAGQAAAEMRELNRDIAERDRKIAEQAVIINNGQQTTIFGQMIQQATAPIINAVGALQKDIDGVKCKLPETTTIPYSPVVGVPTCVAAQYGLGLGLGTPNIWG